MQGTIYAGEYPHTENTQTILRSQSIGFPGPLGPNIANYPYQPQHLASLPPDLTQKFVDSEATLRVEIDVVQHSLAHPGLKEQQKSFLLNRIRELRLRAQHQPS